MSGRSLETILEITPTRRTKYAMPGDTFILVHRILRYNPGHTVQWALDCLGIDRRTEVQITQLPSVKLQILGFKPSTVFIEDFEE